MTGQQGTLLLVDDNPADIRALTAALENRYHLIACTNGCDALWVAADKQPDLILLNVFMEGMNGYDVCRNLQKNDETMAIPVIFLAYTSAFCKRRIQRLSDSNPKARRTEDASTGIAVPSP